MSKSVLFIGLIAFCTVNTEWGNARADENKSPKAAKIFQGKWASIWANADSDKIDKNVFFVFQGNMIQVTYKQGIDPAKGKFKVLPSDRPGSGSIDITITPTRKGVQPETAKGIYILKQDTLVLFIAEAGKPRPKEIHATLKVDDNTWFLVLVREKTDGSKTKPK